MCPVCLKAILPAYLLKGQTDKYIFWDPVDGSIGREPGHGVLPSDFLMYHPAIHRNIMEMWTQSMEIGDVFDRVVKKWAKWVMRQPT